MPIKTRKTRISYNCPIFSYDFPMSSYVFLGFPEIQDGWNMFSEKASVSGEGFRKPVLGFPENQDGCDMFPEKFRFRRGFQRSQFSAQDADSTINN